MESLRDVIHPFAYYLITLLAIEAAFFIAFEHWRRGLSLYARRFAFGFGLLGISRLLLLPLSALNSQTFLPEQAVGVISLGLLAWSFSPHLVNRKALSNLFLTVNTILALLLLISFSFLALDLPWFWYSWQLILSIFCLFSVLALYGHTPGSAIWGFTIITVALLLQLFVGPFLFNDSPIFIRLGEIIAYILFGIAVYLEMINSLKIYSHRLETLSEASQTQVQGLVSLFEATKSITSALDVSSVLDGATKSVVDALGVDQCAIAMPLENEPTQLKMAAVYNSNQQGRSIALTFPLREQTTIKHVMDNQQFVSLEQKKTLRNPEMNFLFALMGAKEGTGPLLIHPLISQGEAIGVLLVGNAQSKREFGASDAQFVDAMAKQIAIAIENAKVYQSEVIKSQQLAWTLRNQEQEAERQRASMVAEMNKSRESVALISQRLQEQEALARKSQKDLTEYQQQVVQLNGQLKDTLENIQSLSDENKRLATSSNTQQQQLAIIEQAENKVVQLKNRVAELELEAEEIDTLNQSLKVAQQRSRRLAIALRRSRAKIQQTSTIPSSLTDAKGSPELESLSFGVLVNNRDGKINRINPMAAQLLNVSAKDIIGKDLSELSTDPVWLEALQKLSTVKESLISIPLKIDQNIIKATISPIPDPNNNHLLGGSIIILYDATDEFDNQQVRDEFVASLSQELRTPMTSLMGYVDLLLSESVGVIGDMQRKFLQRVKANIERMGSMLNDLIGVTAIDAGQLELNPIRLDIADVVEDSIINAKAQIEEKDIELNLELPHQIPPIEADPERIQQVVSNLLNNATKSSPAGGTVMIKGIITNTKNAIPTTEDEAEFDKEIQWLKISISDSGGGIAEKDRKRVFERFYKAERALIQGLGDTGVSLSIVKYLVEAHGGEVWLDTEMGRGTTFHFTLPIADYIDDPWEELDVPPLDFNSDIQEL